MAKVHSFTCAIEADVVDAFCLLQKGFTDQFVYYRKDMPVRFMGLGRCIAFSSLEDVDCLREGPSSHEPVFFSFNRFDAENPCPPDSLAEAFPRLRFMLPEVVLIEDERGAFLQVNSLAPVYRGRVERFVRQVQAAPQRTRRTVEISLEMDSRDAWISQVEEALGAMGALNPQAAEGEAALQGERPKASVQKVVLSRRLGVRASEPFSSKDLLVNLIDGPAKGTVLLYRYADVFFCGCTPELLVRKKGDRVESMCLAGTAPTGASDAEREALAAELMADEKNRREHDYVVQFIRNVFDRTCYNVEVPNTPGILALTNIQHLYTPAQACLLEGTTLWDMVGDLHPTPAVAGTPVGEARLLVRRIEPFNRGFFAGACGYVDGAGDGEFSVALRTGVFDGERGFVYAGCGIVAGSDPAAEYDEIAMKLQTVLSAFDGEC